MKLFFPRICLLFASALIGGLALTANAANDELLTIGSKAPKLDIENWVSDGNGAFKKVTEFESGKVYVVEFWATWCGPCIASMPHLAETQKKYADKGVQLISVSDEDLDTVKEFLQGEVSGEGEADGMTYAKLTSAYCLTADEDRSVHKDYMEAANQNGIPTCFIVGKDGVIEWIGHPMEMDKPLASVVNGNWDREVAKAEIIAEQKRNELMKQISLAMRAGDTDKALQVIDDGLKENADQEETVSFLKSVRVRVQAFPAMQKIREGEVDAGLKMLAELKQDLKGDERDSISEIELGLLMESQKFDEAAPILEEIASSAKPDPMKLNQITWTIYEMAADEKDFNPKLLAAAITAAAKAASVAPDDGAILDTYAHLLHRSGKLDEAIEVQTRAVKNPGGSDDEIKAFLDQLKKEKAGK
ncbi:MAG: redoxin domain-containing protein [Pirellulaceae bacterium]